MACRPRVPFLLRDWCSGRASAPWARATHSGGAGRGLGGAGGVPGGVFRCAARARGRPVGAWRVLVCGARRGCGCQAKTCLNSPTSENSECRSSTTSLPTTKICTKIGSTACAICAPVSRSSAVWTGWPEVTLAITGFVGRRCGNCASISAPAIACITPRPDRPWCCCCAAATSGPRPPTSIAPWNAGRTTSGDYHEQETLSRPRRGHPSIVFRTIRASRRSTSTRFWRMATNRN